LCRFHVAHDFREPGAPGSMAPLNNLRIAEIPTGLPWTCRRLHAE
jgi:hypothetical protein